MYTNILVPTDGTAFSEKVLSDAVNLAKAINAKVTGVHVYSTSPISAYGEFGPSDDVVQKQLRENGVKEGNDAMDRLQTFAKNAGVEFDRVVIERDHVWEGIIQAAQKKHCDLIMMAAHHPGKAVAAILGSDANKVLAHSKIPVMVYH